MSKQTITFLLIFISLMLINISLSQTADLMTF